MPEEIKIVIPGTPVSKPRQTRRDKWLRPPRPCVQKYRDWADKARECAGNLPPPERIAEFKCVAYFAPPASWSQRKKNAVIGEKCRGVVDADNVLKAGMDSLFPQDRGLADVSLRKRWDWTPRLEITIQLEPDDDRPVPAGKRRKDRAAA